MNDNFLDDNNFKIVIKSTPLISIDFIVENSRGEFLLGKRLNRPAKGTLFVPGGRIRKNEMINDAFSRVSRSELGVSLSANSAMFVGLYQHFYEDNYSDDVFSTHYIVLAYKLNLDEKDLRLPVEQHSNYIWLSKKDITVHPLVHNYTKDYFRII